MKYFKDLKVWRKFLSLVSIIFFLFFYVSSADAFTVTPSRILLTVDTCGREEIIASISNDEEKDLVFKSEVLTFKQDNSGRPVFFDNASEAENWVVPEKKQYSVKKGESADVAFRVEVPEGARSGSYYLALTFTALNAESGGKNVLQGRLVSLLFLQVAGRADERLEIKNFDLKKDKNDFDFYFRLENVGNIEVGMKGELIITHLGRKIVKEEIDLGNQLLAYTGRDLKAAAKTGKTILPWPYKAKLKIIYGRTGQTISRVVKFYHFSYLYFGLAALLFVLGFFVLTRFFKNDLKRKRWSGFLNSDKKIH